MKIWHKVRRIVFMRFLFPGEDAGYCYNGTTEASGAAGYETGRAGLIVWVGSAFLSKTIYRLRNRMYAWKDIPLPHSKQFRR